MSEKGVTRETIEGGFVLLNLSVIYKFSYVTLLKAVDYFFGEKSFHLEDNEKPGTGFDLREDFQFDNSDEAFDNLRIWLTYRHEQFHIRHLTASPIGLLLYFIGGRQYNSAAYWLQQWGSRTATVDDFHPKIPLLENHSEDPEIKTITEIKRVFAVYHSVFIDENPNLTLDEAKDAIFPGLFEKIETFCKSALGRNELYPQFHTMGAGQEPVSIGHLTGLAIIEGLARINEYMEMILLKVGTSGLNRLITEKGGGIYNVSLGFLKNFVKGSTEELWLGLARLSDWALQAPVFPFLLSGRTNVALQEILPAWRFMMLISRFDQSGFSLEDLRDHPRGIAEDLFQGLGWESPWRVAERIRTADLVVPKAVLTRHYIENLQLGATIREDEPNVLCFPSGETHGHKLGALYNIFSDRFMPGTTGKLHAEPESFTIPLLLLDDAMVDDVLTRKDLSLSLWIARRLQDFFGKNSPSAGTLIGKKISELFGRTIAIRLLEGMEGWRLSDFEQT